MITIRVNGTDRAVPADSTLDAVVASLSAASRGIAVAVNEDVVPRGDWPGTVLHEADRIEVLTAVQGG